MQVEHTDKNTVEFLDDAGMTFMLMTVHRLNDALKNAGVRNKATRQDICSSFLFELAYHHDAGWLIYEGRKLFPMIAFAERTPAEKGENLGAVQTLHVPTDASSWHEYAHGVVSTYFEDDKEAEPDVTFGSYDINR